jgi:hypothetical protein
MFFCTVHVVMEVVVTVSTKRLDLRGTPKVGDDLFSLFHEFRLTLFGKTEARSFSLDAHLAELRFCEASSSILGIAFLVIISHNILKLMCPSF